MLNNEVQCRLISATAKKLHNKFIIFSFYRMRSEGNTIDFLSTHKVINFRLTFLHSVPRGGAWGMLTNCKRNQPTCRSRSQDRKRRLPCEGSNDSYSPHTAPKCAAHNAKSPRIAIEINALIVYTLSPLKLVF